MFLRPYHPDDLDELLTLFYETVHTVNAADYTPRQLDAWAPAVPDRGRWQRTLAAHTALVAVEEGRIVGFGDIDATGYLDRLYVHREFQHQGIATALCDALEAPYRAATFRSTPRLPPGLFLSGGATPWYAPSR